MAILPEGVGFDTTLQYTDMPTHTYVIDWTSMQVKGFDDGLEAMRQAVDIILHVERFAWQIYSSDFGSEWKDLPGEAYDYIVSEIPRRVSEAFSIDKRILSAENFVFKQPESGVLTCSFDVKTVFGTVKKELEVMIVA